MSRSSRFGAYLAAVIGAVFMAAGAGLAAEVHWTYEGAEGPENWASLSEDFAACAQGREQSPIDIPGTASGGGGELEFDYRPTDLDIVNNGYTVRVNVEPGSTAVLAGKRYRLLQFHFHSPSEHTVGGRGAAMEAHFVHQSPDGGIAVVGVLIEAGAANDALGVIARNMPTRKGAKKIAGATVTGTGLLPASSAFTAYSGSFTTPPCTEGVKWYVMKDRVTVSPEQIAAMQAAMPTNARPTQPLNGRRVLGSN